MMIATEKPGCSNFKKYSFKRAIALIHAGPPKEISLGRVLLGLGALVQNQVIRTPPGTQPTYILSEKNTGPSLLKHIVSKATRRGQRPRREAARR